MKTCNMNLISYIFKFKLSLFNLFGANRVEDQALCVCVFNQLFIIYLYIVSYYLLLNSSVYHEYLYY